MNYPVLDLKATGERINQLRKDNNLRVTDVAEYMGFESTQAVYKWQRCYIKTENPSQYHRCPQSVWEWICVLRLGTILYQNI